MKNFFYRLRYNMALWMQGRYGNDALSAFCLALALVFSIASRAAGGYIRAGLLLLSYGLCILCIFRVYSKNIAKRYAENQKFKQIFRGPLGTFTILKRKKQDPAHLYMKCPNCKTVLRVPKGKGRIVVTCPQCRNKVETRS